MSTIIKPVMSNLLAEKKMFLYSNKSIFDSLNLLITKSGLDLLLVNVKSQNISITASAMSL